MAIGRPITLTDNVASKIISATATDGQTQFTVTGGYRINAIAVYRNGVRLAQSRDFIANDGSTVTLGAPATLDDVIAYQIFDTFSVADAIVAAASTQSRSSAASDVYKRQIVMVFVLPNQGILLLMMDLQ